MTPDSPRPAHGSPPLSPVGPGAALLDYVLPIAWMTALGAGYAAALAGALMGAAWMLGGVER